MAAGSKAEVKKDFPWNKCVMGCTPDPDSSVILLKCLHILCSDACVAKLKAGLSKDCALHCKTCRLIIKPEDLDKRLTPNKAFRKKLTEKDTASVMKCGFCITQGPAEAYCDVCPIYLCGWCRKVHAEARTTYTHRPKTNMEERRLIELEQMKQSLRQCDLHKNESSMFCFTCQAKVCGLDECLSAHGVGHEIVVISAEQEKWQTKLDSVSKLMERLDEAVESLKAKHESIQTEEWMSFQFLIDEEVERIVKIIIERRNAVKLEGKKQFLKQLNVISLKKRRMEFLKKNVAAFRKTLANVANSLDEMSTLKFALLSKSIVNRLNEYSAKLDEDFDSIIEKDKHFILKCEEEPASFETVFSNFGSVEYSVDPAYKPIPLLPAPPPPAETPSSTRVLRSRTKTPDDKAKTYTKNVNVSQNQSSTSPSDSLGNNDETMPVVVNDEHRQHAKSSGTARKSTGWGGRPLGMPHPLHKTSTSSPNVPLPAPPTVSFEKPALKTYPSSRASSSRGQPVPGTSTSASQPEVSQETPMRRKGSKSRHKSSGQGETVSGGGDPSADVTHELTTSSEANPTGSQNDAQRDSETTRQQLHVNGDAHDSGEEEAPSLDNGPVSEDKEDDRHQGATSRNVEEPEMPVLTPNESARKRRRSMARGEDVPEPIADIKVDVISPTSSSTCSDTSVRTGRRERKKKVFPDCVDPEQMRFNKKEDRVDSSPSTSTASTASIPKVRGKSCFSPDSELDSPLEPPSKLPRVVSEDDDDASIATVRIVSTEFLAPPASETGSENGFGDESGSESSSTSRRLSLRRRPEPLHEDQRPETPTTKHRRTKPEIDISVFPEAPMESMEKLPVWCDYPIQGTRDKMKTTEEDYNDDYCCICLDGGEDIIVCCDYCPKVFHLGCHIPSLDEVPDGDDNIKWHCNFDKTREDIDLEISDMEVMPGADGMPLTDGNPAPYLRACKFMMEVYKIEEVPTIKWKFPEAYWEKYNRVPFHLKFLREKLCLPVSKGLIAFQNVEEYMQAFKQMFTQAFLIYTKKNPDRKYAVACFKKFKELVKEYYPDYEGLFEHV